MRSDTWNPAFRLACLAAAACVVATGLPGRATAAGISAKGTTGGLVIPVAATVPDRGMVFNYGNYRESRYDYVPRPWHMALGLGLSPYVEVFGRYTEYNTAPYGKFLHSAGWRGNRDLSANVKVRLPFLPERGPQVALGMHDVAGGNPLFEATYAVATQEWRMLSFSLGYMRDVHEEDATATVAGPFGGVEWRLGATGLALLAEYDGQTSHAGTRWRSPGLARAGDLSAEITLHHMFDHALPRKDVSGTTRFALGLHWPLGRFDERRKDSRPVARPVARVAGESEASADDPGVRPGVEATHTTPASSVATVRAEDLAALRQGLEAAGLERVRTGWRGPSGGADSAGVELVVEYENHRYALNEVDALGLVFGTAVERVPGARRVRAVTLKDGLRVYETGVDAAAYRAFLHGGRAASLAPVRADLTWQGGGAEGSGSVADVEWEREEPSKATRLRFELRPGLNYTLGTELGAFDYSLAARPRLVVPLWRGARATADYVIPVDHTLNMDDGRAFGSMRHSRGLEHVSLGQSFWMGRRALFNMSAGRFNHDAWGVQAEGQVFVPGTAGVIRLKGAAYPSGFDRVEVGDFAGLAAYRHFWGPGHWIDAGWQGYSDGSGGPSFEWTRWSGDVGVTLFGRQGGPTRVAGFTVTLPLTPRRGMKPGVATVAGPGQQREGVRTVLVPEGGTNHVRPGWVRNLELETELDRAAFNGGRMNRAYVADQLYRMREAYHKFGVVGTD